MSPSVSYLRAILIAVAGFSLWTLGDAFMKLASGTSMPKYEVMMIGCLSGMVVVLALMLRHGGLAKLKPRCPGGLLALGLLYSCNYLLMVWIWPQIPLANFYTVVFLAPMVIAILAGVFLREPLGWKQGFAIIAGFGGVVIAVNPTLLFEDRGHLLVYGAVFVCMISNAVQMLLLRMLGPHESRECTVFYLRVVGFVCASGFGMVLGFKTVPMQGLIYAIASGAFGGVGWLFMAQAYKLAPAAVIAPFHYSQLVIGAVLGYVIWRDIPTLNTLAGAAVIIGSGFYMAAHTRKTGALAKALTENPDI